MRLRRKLFLANLAAVGGVVLLALFSQQFLTRSDFDDYRQANLAMAATTLAAEIGHEYSLTGRWGDVLANAWRWPDMFPPLPRRPPRPLDGRPPPPRPLDGRRPPPDRPPPPTADQRVPPPAPAMAPGQPEHPGPAAPGPVRHFMLFNAAREPLSQGRLDLAHATWQDIEAAGATVGYLAWDPKPAEAHPLDAAFAQRQQRALVLIAAGAVVLSILSAWWLSGQLLGRIGVLLGAARKVGAGRLDTAVAVDSGDELGDLATEFNRMTAALAESTARERRWIADAAHELRTPLAVLKGEIEALQDGVRTVDAPALASLHQEVCHLGTLVDDLHLVSSAESGGLRMQLETVNLHDAVESALRVFAPALEEHGIAMDVAIPATLALVADEARLRQVLTNLLQNLVRYAAPGPAEFRALGVGRRAELHLSDSGPGVPDEALPRLFDRLYQHDPARNQEGSGLGLTIVRSIVQAHGGSIRADHSALGGLDIIIDWPLAT